MIEIKFVTEEQRRVELNQYQPARKIGAGRRVKGRTFLVPSDEQAVALVNNPLYIESQHLTKENKRLPSF